MTHIKLTSFLLAMVVQEVIGSDYSPPYGPIAAFLLGRD